MNDCDKKALSETVRLIASNLHPGESLSSNFSLENNPEYKCLPFSAFTLTFPVASAYGVLSFLESRVPGLLFMSYGRDDGIPSLDEVVFGNESNFLFSHPSLKETQGTEISVLGFDLRMVKGFNARPMVGEYGATSFDLTGIVNRWWSSRQPLYNRLKKWIDSSFAEDDNISINAESRTSPLDDTKNTTILKTARSQPNSKSSGNEIKVPNNNPSDLTDIDALMTARSVVVDLGNACWTHRHFSDDIQTRQYRCPEVLIGSK